MINKTYRGKDRETQKWVYGYYVCLNHTEHRIYNGYAETDCGSYYPDFHRVNPKTVGRTTGQQDDNGNEIFEHDIICVNDLMFVVSYGIFGGVPNVNEDMRGYVGFGCVPYDTHTKQQIKYGIRDDLVYWLKNYKCKVIGNIHDR